MNGSLYRKPVALKTLFLVFNTILVLANMLCKMLGLIKLASVRKLSQSNVIKKKERFGKKLSEVSVNCYARVHACYFAKQEKHYCG